MNHLTNAEVARLYGVSDVAVLNWIKQSEKGNNTLELVLINSKPKVRDSIHNRSELARLANMGKKFRRNTNYKKVAVDNVFYRFFNLEEQIEIINDLQYRNFVNLKFYYRYKGAEFWNENYLHGDSNIPTEVNKLITNSLGNITGNLQHSKINIIDIGCGNGYPAKTIMDSLDTNKYIAVDISQEMLNLCLSNISNWYPKIETKSYMLDVENSRFGSVLLDNRDNNVSNLILFLGSTICNSDDRIRILKNFASCMKMEDLLVFSFSLDNTANRSTLNYVKPINDYDWAWIPSVLGIDVRECNVELTYNAELGCKEKLLVLDKDYTITAKLGTQEEIIELQKGTKINRWKHYLLSVPEVISEIEHCGLRMEFIANTESNALIGVKLRV